MAKNKLETISGNTFNGPTNIFSGDYNAGLGENIKEPVASYTTVPVWRTPFTLAVLTWLSVIIGVAGLFPIYKVFEPLIQVFTLHTLNLGKETSIPNTTIYVTLSILALFFFCICLFLRKVVKNETRHALIFDFSIKGSDGRITLDKVKPGKCPICGGKMKYYNKVTEWKDITDSEGRTEREILKRRPVLECKRNPDHWFLVDPAEDKI